MEKESIESKPGNPEEQDDSWVDLTGEYEKVENCSAPEDSTEDHSGENGIRNCSSQEDSTNEHFQEKGKEKSSTSEGSTNENSQEEENEICNTPKSCTKIYSEDGETDSRSTSEDCTKELSEEEKENGVLQKLPSFEVLTEFPRPDFLKLRENVFTQQETTFAFKNMITSECPLIGLRRRIPKQANWFINNQDNYEKKVTLKIKKKSKRKKHKKSKGRDFVSSTSGLVLALFATNVITFVLGCSLGWWTRDAIPSLSVYEFHLDPALL